MGEVVASIDSIVKSEMESREFILDVVEMGKGQIQTFMKEHTRPFFTL
jgi:hypothetical protein